MRKRILCLLLCTCLLASVPTFATEPIPAATAGGWNETLWLEAPEISDGDVTAVSYIGPVSGSLTGQDFEHLVRDTENGLRIDIPGLPAGNYNLTVSTKNGDIVYENITVTAQDRSGFAHFGDTEGVGAYDNEGKLKENAIVLYVTDENKDTVTITAKDGTTVSGIGNILNTSGKSGAGLTNTNQDILRKLAADGTPLVVRVVGRVTAPFGLTAWGSRDYGGNPDDNGSMARMQGGKHITIEGIGEAATIDGWGLSFICGGDYDYTRGWGRSFEVRNLTFVNVPEDCVGMEGEQKDGVLNAPVERCWVHHCAFYGPTILNDASSDQDKGGGDGACDFKRGQYFTNSYCYYYGYHKTNLVGGGNSDQQYHLTYHHNYWKNCESRGPLARQADIHMYNNIFEDQSSYCMNPRANAYIYSEFNLFLNSKDPVRVDSGAVKSFGDAFENCRGRNQATIVSDKATPVDTGCKYANFDTNADFSYIPDRNYILQESIGEMKAVVLAQAGPQGLTFETQMPDVPDIGDITVAPGSYVHDFTENGKQSDFFTITGNLSTGKGSVSFDGKTLTQCLKMESSTEIRFGAPESGTLILVFGGTTDGAGKTVKLDGAKHTLDANGMLSVAVTAGWHTITKGDSINLFYMAYTSDPAVHVHDFTDWITAPGGGSMTRGCQTCGYQETISLADCPHSETEVLDAVASTCFTEGFTGRVFCLLCGKMVDAGKVLPVIAHSYEVEVIAPGCTVGGGIVHTCTACGKSYTDAATAPLGHSYAAEVTAATCTQDGYTTYTCETCSDNYTEVSAAATGHQYQLTETETATVYTCSICGHSYQNEKLPCSHAYGAWETIKEPTEQEGGVQERSCSLCGEKETQELLPTGHANANHSWIWAAVGSVGAISIAAVLILKKKKAA